ncbi:ATP synthase F0 subcomplex B subunit [Tranquillimonas rosea]|uniref:ATP synthase subunit b n=1 Tax=Tranquillimonas rosea TaxID=641238 RepID=A0A1H9QZ54_9RHOB|nr:F0F1 ATP synthase subunit B [Tranquillimonas rosea]SER65891.1 ATP synthase F0 subcomplex B subunit [Tranquillimonas rosea]
MTRAILTLTAASVTATPALAAGDSFFVLSNTDFVVLVAFVLFIGVLAFFQVPERLMGMLDTRAAGIKKDLDEARELREEAQTLLASYERKQKEVQAQADRIVAKAKADAEANARAAKDDIDRSVERRIQAAEDQIASAEAAAIRDIRNRAIDVAVAAARDVVSKEMTAQKANAMIEDSIKTVEAKLH